MRYCEVVLPGVPKPLTYSIPAGYDAEPGQLVLVPLGNRKAYGIVTSLDPSFVPNDTKEIIEIEPLVVPHPLLKLARWMSEYYLTDLGHTLRLFFPPGSLRMEVLMVRAVKQPDERLDDLQSKVMGYLLQRQGRWVPMKTLTSVFGSNVPTVIRYFQMRGWAEMRYFMRRPRKKGTQVEKFLQYAASVELPVKPSPEQKRAIELVAPTITERQFGSFLLHGVTGSGKTFVYLELAKVALSAGRSVLMLVPEIGLTPQIAAQFIKAFGEQVGIYHSKFTAAERRWVWRNVYDGSIRVVVGPRSALFLPFKDLGLILVDEEHDPSYKQNDSPPLYNARDVAVVRANMEKSAVVLGSATPSAESYFNAMRKKYIYIPMRKRVVGYHAPKITVIDMKQVRSASPLSIQLLEQIQKTVAGGKQVILFLNRRGFSPHIQCLDCGYVFKCPNCSVTLTYHRKERKLMCHLCGYELPAPDTCPRCGSTRLKPVGTGTEKVENEILKVLPRARILRMDLDTTRSKKHAHEEIYEKFRRHEADILIGTQMIVKGFDFPNVALVGVVLADIGLNLPDFRAEERVFQLITQVIGRARRGGLVVIQTYSPNSPAITYALRADYHGFMKEEFERRKEFGYPPFRRLVSIILSGKSLEKVRQAADTVYEKLTGVEDGDVEIYPPSPAPIEKLRGKYRYRILLKGRAPYAAQSVIRKAEIKTPSSIHIMYDVDPLDML